MLLHISAANIHWTFSYSVQNNPVFIGAIRNMVHATLMCGCCNLMDLPKKNAMRREFPSHLPEINRMVKQISDENGPTRFVHSIKTSHDTCYFHHRKFVEIALIRALWPENGYAFSLRSKIISSSFFPIKNDIVATTLIAAWSKHSNKYDAMAFVSFSNSKSLARTNNSNIVNDFSINDIHHAFNLSTFSLFRLHCVPPLSPTPLHLNRNLNDNPANTHKQHLHSRQRLAQNLI